MQKLLVVKSSILGDEGHSNAMAEHFLKRWTNQRPSAPVVIRDLLEKPVPHLDQKRFAALTTDAAQRTQAEQWIVDESDLLIDEIREATTVVLAVPMYNFGIPSTMKAYFDHIARAGVTFRYTSTGVEGLLGGRRVLVLASRGGLYRDTADDLQTPYLRNFLGFLGMDELHFVFAEGLAMGEDSANRSMNSAQAEIDAWIRAQDAVTT